MAARLKCYACGKDNCRFCLGQVLEVSTGDMIDCECSHGQEDVSDDQLRAEQTYGGERRGHSDYV